MKLGISEFYLNYITMLEYMIKLYVIIKKLKDYLFGHTNIL